MAGRFAPSPTGDLHIGNLRTAAIAWLSARAAGLEFIVRVEDLDLATATREHEQAQLDDLRALGIDWDGPIVRQSERFEIYDDAIDRLRGAGLVYDCYCSRREIRMEIEAAPSAPHLPPGSYPGTCRDLSEAGAAERRRAGRPPALRLRTDGRRLSFHDRLVGPVDGGVDDVVLRRNDGVPSYNLAVVVDDALQGVTEVVRGNDLLLSTPRQLLLQELLGLPHPEYFHVPLVLGDDGERLAKRHGAVTLADLGARGVEPRDVVAWIAGTIGMTAGSSRARPSTLADLLGEFDPERIPTSDIRAPDLVRSP